MLLSPVAALSGNACATAALWVWSSVGEDAPKLSDGMFVIMFTVVTAFFSFPFCLILGTPVIYAFRRQLIVAPWRWGLLVAFIGMWLGAVAVMLLSGGRGDPGLLIIVLVYSAMCAFCFSVLYGYTARYSARRIEASELT